MILLLTVFRQILQILAAVISSSKVVDAPLIMLTVLLSDSSYTGLLSVSERSLLQRELYFI